MVTAQAKAEEMGRLGSLGIGGEVAINHGKSQRAAISAPG